MHRRAFLRASCCQGLGLTGLLGASEAWAQSNAAQTASQTDWASLLSNRFARPAIDTDEGGLWAMMDREETRLRRSSQVVRDSRLQGYLRDMVCRLVGDHCTDIRVHVVRTPFFNATMAPNGMMQIWSGLLLRVDNEAQLAAVIGHEIGHYLERHSLERLRDMKSRAAFGQFIGMFGAVGALGQLGMLAGAFAFSREHETRADVLGMRLLKRAGYRAQEAAQVWDNLLGELQIRGGSDVGQRSPMMATHPPVATRRDDLLKLAGDDSGETRTEQLAQMLAPHRLDWIQDEIRRGQHEESLVLFGRMVQKRPGDAQAWYGRGEIYRLRGQDKDLPLALQDLQQAVQIPEAPAVAHRSLGLIHKQQAQKTEAMASFEKYLELAPQAPDAALVRSYITELQS
jgi:beta-barrel assembly-enhancing protease